MCITLVGLCFFFQLLSTNWFHLSSATWKHTHGMMPTTRPAWKTRGVSVWMGVFVLRIVDFYSIWSCAVGGPKGRKTNDFTIVQTGAAPCFQGCTLQRNLMIRMQSFYVPHVFPFQETTHSCWKQFRVKPYVAVWSRTDIQFRKRFVFDFVWSSTKWNSGRHCPLQGTCIQHPSKHGCPGFSNQPPSVQLEGSVSPTGISHMVHQQKDL